MKKLLTIPVMALAISSVTLTSCDGNNNKNNMAMDSMAAAPSTDLEKQSYSAGFAQGGQMNKMSTDLGVTFDMAQFQQGFKDAYGNKDAVLSQEDMDAALMALQKSIMEKQRAFMEKQFTDNKQKSEEFLATKAKDTKVNKLKNGNGVLYEVVSASKNNKTNPKASDTVKVTYKGTTIDGREFDSNEDVELNLSDLIKGWQAALTNMSPGDKWKIYVPADQAYGERGAPGIMPNSALIFDIELKDIVKNSKKK